MNSPFKLNENVVISTTKIESESLDRFFQGESIALTLERDRTVGINPVPENIDEERLNDIHLTPAYFRRRRNESERLKRREGKRQEDDLMLYTRLIQKKFNTPGQ
jgi:hypothetical protein